MTLNAASTTVTLREVYPKHPLDKLALLSFLFLWSGKTDDTLTNTVCFTGWSWTVSDPVLLTLFTWSLSCCILIHVYCTWTAHFTISSILSHSTINWKHITSILHVLSFHYLPNDFYCIIEFIKNWYHSFSSKQLPNVSNT